MALTRKQWPTIGAVVVVLLGLGWTSVRETSDRASSTRAAEPASTPAATVEELTSAAPPRHGDEETVAREETPSSVETSARPSTEQRQLLLTSLGQALSGPVNLEALEALCEQGLGEACFQVAERHLHGADGAARDLAVAEDRFIRGCTLGDATACTALSTVTENPSWVVRGCDLGDGRACASLGARALEDPKNAQDLAEARRYFELACDRPGGAEGCGALGRLFEAGVGVPKDIARAKRYFFVACRGGARWACR